MAIGFGSLLLMFSRLLQNALGTGLNTILATWYPLISVGFSLLLFVGKDLAFLFWARGRLYGRFREQAVRSLNPGGFAATPVPVVKIVAPPPVIGAGG